MDLFCANAVVFRSNGVLSNFQQTWTPSLIANDPNAPELYPKSDA